MNGMRTFALLAVLLSVTTGVCAQTRLSEEVSGVWIDRIVLRFEGPEKGQNPRTHSAVFAAARLDEILCKYERKTLTAEDLAAVTRDLTRLYVDSGFVTSGALISDQPVKVVAMEGGARQTSIEVVIVEGGAAAVSTANNHLLRNRWYERRLGANSRRPLNRTELESRLEQLHADPRIRRFDAVLKPGTALGRSELQLNVEEAFPVSFNLQFDNYQSPAVGAERVVGSAALMRVIGIGDELRVSYGGSRGVAPLLTAAYSLPVGPYDTTLTAGYRRNDFLVVQQLFRPLDVTSNSEIFSAGIRQPLLHSQVSRYRATDSGNQAATAPADRSTREIVAGLDAESLRNRSYLLGEPFSFSAGAVNGRYSITALRLSQEFTQWKTGQVIAFRSRLSLGLNALGSTVHRDPGSTPEGTPLVRPDSRFVSWLGQWQMVQRVPVGAHAIELLLRAEGQLANKPLLPLEQLPIGGRYSVRGHRENALVRDQGFTTTVEFRLPLAERRTWASRLDLVPFWDHGYGEDKVSTASSPGRSIGSAGLGLRWARRIGRGYGLTPAFEVYWGALRYHRDPLSRGDLQDRGLHFQFSLAGE